MATAAAGLHRDRLIRMLPNWADDDSRTSNAGHNHSSLRRPGRWTRPGRYVGRRKLTQAGRRSAFGHPEGRCVLNGLLASQVGMYREVPPPYRFPHSIRPCPIPPPASDLCKSPFPVPISVSARWTRCSADDPSLSSPGRCLCHFGAIASSSARHRTASLNANQRTPHEKATASTEVWQQANMVHLA